MKRGGGTYLQEAVAVVFPKRCEGGDMCVCVLQERGEGYHSTQMAMKYADNSILSWQSCASPAWLIGEAKGPPPWTAGPAGVKGQSNV